jgi:hypothetical protein
MTPTDNSPAGPFQLKDGSHVADIKLDRLVQFDERSRNYGVMNVVGDSEVTLNSRLWALPHAYMVNQGQEGACVSGGFGHDSIAAPYQTSQLTMDWLREFVYFEAQREDPWPGGAYPGASPQYEGTSVLTGAKVMSDYGFFKSYHWAFSIDEMVTALMTLGTVVLGLNWNEGQMYPDAQAVMTYTGKNLGGHCVCCRGLLVPNKSGNITASKSGWFGDRKFSEPLAVITQSWGLDYGHQGEVYMPLSELERALKDDGECCVPTERQRVDVRKLVPPVL